MSKLPRSRQDEIVVRQLNDEVLIYDLTVHKAYCLNETAGVIFNACDGEMTFKELKRKHDFTDDVIFLAIDELKKLNLIGDDYASPFAGMNRRQVIRRIGTVSMVALPVIISLVAPSASAAQSVACVTSGNPCTGTFPASQGVCCDGCTCNPASNQCIGAC